VVIPIKHPPLKIFKFLSCTESAFKQSLMKAETTVLIGAPAVIPDGLIDALIKVCQKNTEIESAYLGQVYIQAEGEVPHKALVVNTVGVSESVETAIFKEFGVAARGLMGDADYIDIFIDQEESIVSTDVMNLVEPFYRK
jgi:hypothetical protein